MKLYQVGPDEFSDYERKEIDNKYDFYIYWYERGSYEGDGLGVGVNDGRADGVNGTAEVYSLSHCSCYGPTEDSSGDIYPLEEFLTFDVYDDCVKGRKRNPEDRGYVWWVSVVGKVREVLENAG